MVLGIVFQTMGFIMVKFIYQINSSISTFEIMTSRALVQVVFNMVLVNYMQQAKSEN